MAAKEDKMPFARTVALLVGSARTEQAMVLKLVSDTQDDGGSVVPSKQDAKRQDMRPSEVSPGVRREKDIAIRGCALGLFAVVQQAVEHTPKAFGLLFCSVWLPAIHQHYYTARSSCTLRVGRH
jgi:hypothetical protein